MIDTDKTIIGPRAILLSFANGFLHWCQGCGMDHYIPTSGNTAWAFNGNLESPTFSPSVKHSWPSGKQCHYFINDGRIDFCGDSTHALAGQTVPLLPINDQYKAEAADDHESP